MSRLHRKQQKNLVLLSSSTREENFQYPPGSSLLLYKHGQNHIKASIHASIRAALDDTSTRSTIPFTKTIEEVYDGVYDGPILGVGVSGQVRLIKSKETGQMYALKRLDMSILGNGATLNRFDLAKVKKEKHALQLLEEIESMCQVNHPNIIKLEEIYESDQYIYMVEELCPGGELFSRLVKERKNHFTEEQCGQVIAQIVSAVQYIHSLGIIHRDLKLENFLFKKKDSFQELRLIDFGLAKHLKYGEKAQEKVGTPYTVAPEVLRGTYDERCDVWAIGVITYLLLSGDTPFGGCHGEPLREVRDNILSGKFEFVPKELWVKISDEAKEFIQSTLQVDPDKRPTSMELKRNLWLQRFMKNKADNCWFNVNHILQQLPPNVTSFLQKLPFKVLSPLE